MNIRLSLRGFALAGVLVLAWQPLTCLPQTAIGNVNLPTNNAFQQGSDRVKAADGTECSTSVAPREKYMEVGIVGQGVGGQGAEGGQYPYVGSNNFVAPPTTYSRAGGAAYARVIINLDAAAPKIDCTQLMALEIERLKSEIAASKLVTNGKAVGVK